MKALLGQLESFVRDAANEERARRRSGPEAELAVFPELFLTGCIEEAHTLAIAQLHIELVEHQRGRPSDPPPRHRQLRERHAR